MASIWAGSADVPAGPWGPRMFAPSTGGIPDLLAVQLRFPDPSTLGA